jgi:hypothetical protein
VSGTGTGMEAGMEAGTGTELLKTTKTLGSEQGHISKWSLSTSNDAKHENALWGFERFNL